MQYCHWDDFISKIGNTEIKYGRFVIRKRAEEELKMKNLFKQIIRFGLAGFISTITDFTVFSMLDTLHIHYMIANIMSFSCSMVVNYWLSMNFVFVRRQNWSRKREFVVFALLGVAGLLINTASLWILYNVLSIRVVSAKIGMNEHMGKLICKMGATVVLLIYNFVSRKIFLEKKKERSGYEC